MIFDFGFSLFMAKDFINDGRKLSQDLYFIFYISVNISYWAMKFVLVLYLMLKIGEFEETNSLGRDETFIDLMSSSI